MIIYTDNPEDRLSGYYALYSYPSDGLDSDDSDDDDANGWPMRDVIIGSFETLEELLVAISKTLECSPSSTFTSAQDVYDTCYFQWDFGKGLFGQHIHLYYDGKLIPHDSEAAQEHRRKQEEERQKREQAIAERQEELRQKEQKRMEWFEKNKRVSLPRACKRDVGGAK